MEVDKVKIRSAYFQKLSSTKTQDTLYEIENHAERNPSIIPIESFDGDIIIVAVHGLNGHFYRTWAYDATFWLSDMLPCAFPNARIFSFSYDSAVLTKSIGNLERFARTMLEQLLIVRMTRQDKGVLFICHSQGGLVVKKAMVVANEESKFRQILESTKVITFMGTPHRGSDYAKTLGDIAKIAQTSRLRRFVGYKGKLVKDLESHSDTLTQLNNSFRERMLHIRIVSFFEMYPPYRFFNRPVVEEDSAILSSEQEDRNSLAYNHAEMCKVNSNDKECRHFLTILRPIKSQLEKAEKLTFCSEPSLGTRGISDMKKQNIDLPTSELYPGQFQNRGDELKSLKQLADGYTDPNSPLVLLLHGFPGMGKTELALEFLKALQPKYRVQLHLDAESEESLQNSFCRVADLLRITASNESGPLASARGPIPSIDTIVANVRHELNSRRDPWVLLFDNYIPKFDLHQKIPDRSQGIILVCAADQQASQIRIGAQAGCTIHVKSMDKQHLISYFWCKVKGDSGYKSPDGKINEAVDALIEKFKCHTLSVRLAATYFGECKRGHVTIEELMNYRTAIDQEPGSGFDGDINEYAQKPWQLLIRQLQNRDNEVVIDVAIEYLQLRAFFSHDHLPTSKLFRNVAKHRCHRAWVRHDHLPTRLDHRQGYARRIEHAEDCLSNYGLVAIEVLQDDRGTRMLPIFQLYARRLLWEPAAGEKRSHDWCVALCVLGESIEWSFDHEAVSFRKALVPHIDTCLYEDSIDKALDKIEIRTAGNILLNFAAAYTEVGKFDRAGELQHKALDHLIKHVEPEDDLTLTAKGELASNLDLRDKAMEAMKLREEVLEQRRRVYSQNRNDHIAECKYVSAASLTAISYARLPEYKHNALKLRVFVLEFTEKANDSWTDDQRPGVLALLKAKRELATSFAEMGRNTESLRLREEIVNSMDQGKDIFFMNARRELLTSLSSARQLARAFDLGTSIVKDSESLLGPDHPDTWLAKSVLATLRSHMGQRDEAKKDLQMAVARFREIWGAEHPITISAQVELARVQLARKEGEDEKEAMNTFQNNSDLYGERYGEKSWQKLESDMEMAIVLQHRGTGQALPKMQHIVSDLESILPADDSGLTFAKLQLAGCFAQFGDLKAAASGYELLLSVLGADARPTSRYLKAKLRLASTYLKLADSKPTIEGNDLESYLSRSNTPPAVHDEPESASEDFSKSAMISQVLRAGIRKLKPKASVETIRSNPGPVYKDYDRAKLRQKALELQEEVIKSVGGIEHGLSDKLTAQACFELAKSYALQSRYGEAVDLQRAVVSFFVQNNGKDDPETRQNQGMLKSWKMLCNE